MTEEKTDGNTQQPSNDGNTTVKRTRKDTLFTKENASENGKKGAKKTNEIKREKKTLRENFKLLLECGIPKGSEFEKIMKARGLKGDTLGEALNLSTLLEAIKGNAQMTKIAYDLADEGDSAAAEPLNISVNIQSLKGGEEVDEVYKEKKGEDGE